MRRLTQVQGRRTNPFGLVTLALLALALPFAASVASAQTGTIVGTVTDGASKTPIPSVQIQIVGSTRGVISGPDGHYRFVGVPSGSTQLRVTRIGYAAATQTVNVPTGDVATADFVLTATQVPLDQVVVTGTLVNERERETGNLVAVIQTDSVNKGPIETFSDLIAGKAAGVDVDASRPPITLERDLLAEALLVVGDGGDHILQVDAGSSSVARELERHRLLVGQQQFADLRAQRILSGECQRG